MQLLNVILSLVITCKISNNFLSNDILNNNTADSKDRESIQSSIISDKGHQRDKTHKKTSLTGEQIGQPLPGR